MGIMASLPLMIRLFDKKNQFVKRLCATNNIESKANCSSILDSPNAFLFKVITWSEVGFIYFTSMFLFLLSFRRPESGIIVSSVSILVSPYIIYSIYYQWRIAKIWCRICLMVQLILFVELVLGIVYIKIYHQNVSQISFENFLQLGLSTFFIISVYFLIKPVVTDSNHYKAQIPNLTKIKLNNEVFNFLLKRTAPVSLDSITPIQFGNLGGKHIITIITNPICRPCIDLHKELFNILRTKQNTLVNEIFFPDKKKDMSYRIADFMLRLYCSEDLGVVEKAFIEYYHDSDFKKMEEKHYKKLMHSVEPEIDLNGHIEWCLKREIVSTPTVLFNGYRLPDDYTISDLDYLTD